MAMSDPWKNDNPNPILDIKRELARLRQIAEAAPSMENAVADWHDKAREIADRLNLALDTCAARLYASGVAFDRMLLWQERGGRDSGIMVDGQRACTVSVRFSMIGGPALHADVSITFHPPFVAAGVMDDEGDEARLVELRKLMVR